MGSGAHPSLLYETPVATLPDHVAGRPTSSVSCTIISRVVQTGHPPIGGAAPAGRPREAYCGDMPEIGTCPVCGRRFATFRLLTTGTLVLLHHNNEPKTPCEGARGPP